jgi:hypothetical protein
VGTIADRKDTNNFLKLKKFSTAFLTGRGSDGGICPSAWGAAKSALSPVAAKRLYHSEFLYNPRSIFERGLYNKRLNVSELAATF